MPVEIRNIAKRFGDAVALDGVNLDVADGQLVALLGPSGSGKTSLLRIIAGLDRPSSGQVLFNDRDATARSPAERGIGFVFQHYALFRHMTVFENVAFGLRVRKRRERLGSGDIRRRVEELLDLVQLSEFAKRFPRELSGGQRQRVALARALAVGPRLLLLDEPFGALDAVVRYDLRLWLASLHRQLGLTTVFVTHDQTEAFELGDRVAVMRQGRIEQVGTPAEIYDHPANLFVMEFVGRANRIGCEVRGGRIRAIAGWEIDGNMHCTLPDGSATAYVRPEDVVVRAMNAHGVGGRLNRRTALGNRLRVVIERGGEAIEAEILRHEKPAGLEEGAAVRVSFRRFCIFSGDAPVSVHGKAPSYQPALPRATVCMVDQPRL